MTGENTPKGQAVKRLKEIVAARSGGTVEIQAFPNAGLYADENEIEELEKGSVQLIAPHTAKLSEVVPEAQLLDLPYLFDSVNEVHSAMDGKVGKELATLLDQKGLKLLALWDNGFKQVTTNSRPVIDPRDFAGLSIRIAPSYVIEEQYRLVKAQTVPLPFDELYEALENGTVDGEENTVSNIHNKRLYTVQRYLTKSAHSYLGYFVLTSKDFWDSLPLETQTLIEDALREVTIWEYAKALELEKEQSQVLFQEMEVYKLTERDKSKWRNAFQGTYQWYTNEIDNEVLEKYVADQVN